MRLRPLLGLLFILTLAGNVSAFVPQNPRPEIHIINYCESVWQIGEGRIRLISIEALLCDEPSIRIADHLNAPTIGELKFLCEFGNLLNVNAGITCRQDVNLSLARSSGQQQANG